MAGKLGMGIKSLFAKRPAEPAAVVENGEEAKPEAAENEEEKK